MNRHLYYLNSKINFLETLIKEKMNLHDSSNDLDYKNQLYSEVHRMEKTLSQNLSLFRSEQKLNNQILRRTYSVRSPKFKTRSLLISNDGLHKKRKLVKTLNQKCFEYIRNTKDTVVVVGGGRKRIQASEFIRFSDGFSDIDCISIPSYKYSSGMDINWDGKKKRVFNSILKTEIEEDILDIYHEEQMQHFPQDKRMMEKDMKLKTLRFAEKVCGLLFNNQKMLEKGYT